MPKIAAVVAFVVAVLCTSAVVAEPDESAIVRLLHGMFDRPGQSLVDALIVVSGDHVIADWTQGDMGGRALLRWRHQETGHLFCAPATASSPKKP